MRLHGKIMSITMFQKFTTKENVNENIPRRRFFLDSSKDFYYEKISNKDYSGMGLVVEVRVREFDENFKVDVFPDILKITGSTEVSALTIETIKKHVGDEIIVNFYSNFSTKKYVMISEMDEKKEKYSKLNMFLFDPNILLKEK